MNFIIFAVHKYIVSALINARELYGTSVTGAPDGFNALAVSHFITVVLQWLEHLWNHENMF